MTFASLLRTLPLLALAAGIPAAAAMAAGPLVVGYYMNWNKGTYTPDHIPYQHITHIAHAFLEPASNGSLSNGSYFAFPALVQKAHEHGVKVVASVGGWGFDSQFTALAADTAARHRFVREVTDFCVTNGYDGADIDWEYPGTAAEAEQMRLLIRELRQSFDAVDPSLLLAIAAPGGWWSGRWFPVETMAGDLSWIGIMTYDFYGTWTAKCGPNSAIYPSPQNDQGWVDNGYMYYRNRGVAAEKLLTGTPFYGWIYNSTGMYETNNGGASQASYAGIIPRLQQGWTRSWDATGLVPYMTDPGKTKVVSYDDSASVAAKCEYIKSRQAGGTIVWALGQDMVDGRQPLLEAVGAGLRGTAAAPAAESLPSRFALEQNYPNPFNGQTTIRYSVGTAGRVTIALYDLLGREVKVLVNADHQPGTYSVSLRADDLASGAYLYRMTAGGFSSAQQMTLLR